MRVVARRRPSMWRMPRPRPFEPEGFTLGAEVRLSARMDGFTGQIWAHGNAPRTWWVVEHDGTAHLEHEASLTVLGQCADQPLEGVA